VRSGQIVGGRYEVLDHIASGGMGAVYRARHLISDRVVALKVLFEHAAHDLTHAERFRREARAAAAIDHPGVVEVLDAGVDDGGLLFLAMELLEGEHLGTRLTREGTTLADGLSLILHALDPLTAAHARGFVHRDLKPENLFVLHDGSLRLLDFGIAKPLEGNSATRTGASLGTPYYMAPEQVMSARRVTPAADVWAVGVILYELLTGRLPFEGPTPEAVVVRACTERATPVAEHFDGAPNLSALVDACLAQEPEERPADAATLRQRLIGAIERDGPFDAIPLTLSRYVDAAPTATSDPRLAPPRHTTPSAAPRDGWRRIEGDGWAVEVPPEWERLESVTPHVAMRMGVGPVLARLKIDEWDGSSEDYVHLGLDKLGAIAELLRYGEARMGGHAALEADAIHDYADPPIRTLRRAFAHGGKGYMLHCEAPVDGYVGHLPVFKAILSSFALR